MGMADRDYRGCRPRAGAANLGHLTFMVGPKMKAHATVGRVDGPQRIGRQCRMALGGAIVILALASGMAMGFGAVVERLSTTGMPAGERPAAANESRTRLPGPPISDLSQAERAAFFYDEEDGSSCDRAPCHRIRRWLTTTAGPCDATGGRMQYEDSTTGIPVELEVEPCLYGWS